MTAPKKFSPKTQAALEAANVGQVLVRFLRREAPWNAGEELLVHSARAERWVAEGVAEYAR